MRVDASGERRRGAGPRGRAAHVPQAQRAVHAPRREDRGEGGGRVVRGGNGGNAAAAGDEDRLRAPPAVRDPGHERGDPPRRTIIGVRTIGVRTGGVEGGGRRGSERPHGDAAAVSAAAQQRRRASSSRVRRRAFASSDESIVVVRVVRVEGVEPFLARGVVEDDVLDLLEPDEERPPRGGEGARARPTKTPPLARLRLRLGTRIERRSCRRRSPGRLRRPTRDFRPTVVRRFERIRRGAVAPPPPPRARRGRAAPPRRRRRRRRRTRASSASSGASGGAGRRAPRGPRARPWSLGGTGRGRAARGACPRSSRRRRRRAGRGRRCREGACARGSARCARREGARTPPRRRRRPRPRPSRNRRSSPRRRGGGRGRPRGGAGGVRRRRGRGRGRGRGRRRGGRRRRDVLLGNGRRDARLGIFLLRGRGRGRGGGGGRHHPGLRPHAPKRPVGKVRAGHRAGADAGARRPCEGLSKSTSHQECVGGQQLLMELRVRVRDVGTPAS